MPAMPQESAFRPWVVRQQCRDVLFAHWPTPAGALQRLLPRGIDLDSFEGEAWISVVAFRMTGLTTRWLPAIPGVSPFVQLNVRTYVRVGGRPGVYFFSLDADSRIVVAVARAWFHLPYYRARMSVSSGSGTTHYASRRCEPGMPPAEFGAACRAAGPEFRPRPGTLDHWLTERYRLYAGDRAGRIRLGEIGHQPWVLRAVEAEIASNTMMPPGVAVPTALPRLQLAAEADIVAWAPVGIS